MPTVENLEGVNKRISSVSGRVVIRGCIDSSFFISTEDVRTISLEECENCRIVFSRIRKKFDIQNCHNCTIVGEYIPTVSVLYSSDLRFEIEVPDDTMFYTKNCLYIYANRLTVPHNPFNGIILSEWGDSSFKETDFISEY